MSNNISSFIFQDIEILRTDKPVPVVNIRPLLDDNKNRIGSTFTIVIPARNFITLTVKVRGSNAYESYEAGSSCSASFQGLTAKAYAIPRGNQMLSGWTASADSVSLIRGGDFL